MSKNSINKLIEKLYVLFSISVPFAVVAIYFGGYIFSVSTLFLIILDVLLLVRGKFLISSLVSVVIFLLWCLLGAIPRLEVGTYLFSLFALTAMVIPLTVSIPWEVRPRKIIRAFVYGLVGSFVLATYELGVNAGLPPLTDILSGIGLWGTDAIQESEYFGIYRTKSAQTEPAHYAHFLAFAYALLDQADQRGFQVPRASLLKLVTAFFIFSTVSLSGLVMFIGYLGMVGILEWRHRVLGKLFSLSFWVILPLFIISAAVIFQLYGQSIAEYVFWTYGRLEEAVAAIQLGLVKGSEASRARSATIHFEYWASQDWWGALIGEGYGNQSEWLINEYGHLEGTSFARGSLHNNFAYVGLTTGVVGLISYIFSIFTFMKDRCRIPLSIFGIWILAHFAMGYLTFYRFWWPLILASAVFRKRKYNV